MINNYLERQIKENFSYNPTFEQEIAINRLSGFITSNVNEGVFLLRGHAGTGKTSLAGAVVKTLLQLKQKVMLLAPTGRAAKVFSQYASHPAFTIHRKIYRQRAFSNSTDNFSLGDNLFNHTLFIVDEASMISNSYYSGLGSGGLLDDLIQFVYSGTGCRLLLMGDNAQLPPVGETESPALSVEWMKCYGLELHEADLTEVVRQGTESGVLWNATLLRKMMEEDPWGAPTLKLNGFTDIVNVRGDELIEVISDCYARDGKDDTIVICRSNKRANIYNNGIRNRILYREEELSNGDFIMIAKNNYFWTKEVSEMEFIANGDIAIVRRSRRYRDMYGFKFADVTFSFPDYNDLELEATVLLDTLQSDAPSLLKEESDRLFEKVSEDYQEITVKKERMKKIKEDPYYNALQIKFAYAVTCHKAQGGQWKNVFLDQGYIPEESFTVDYYRWLYTALTRATGKVYLVNFPEDQMEAE